MYVHRYYNGERIPQYTCAEYSKYPIGTCCTAQHRINVSGNMRTESRPRSGGRWRPKKRHSAPRTWQKACSISRAACRSRSRRKARYQPAPSFHHRIKAKSRPSDHPSDNIGYIFQHQIANYLCFSGLVSSVHFSGLLSSGIRPEKICS